jgi:leucyl/phenylalanyl-tRNA--protein transferase
MAGLTPDLLLQAYAVGLFPMAERRDDPALYWIDPEQRAVLPLDGFHLSKRLARTVRSNRFEIRCDTAFTDVMRACAEPADNRRESWINEPILQLYTALFHRGQAHSVEAWRAGRLVGGLYGVSLGGAFFGESMFSRETDASKVALVHLVARLRVGGFKLLDCQFMTDHLRQFGVVEISRDDYRKRLAKAVKVDAEFQRDLMGAAESLVLQPITHTS